MSKRRLSRQQQERISTRQTQKQHRADTGADVENVGDLGPEIPGLVVCHYGQQLEVEADESGPKGRLFRCHQRSNLPPLVSGDRVVWQANGDASGVVVALTPRRNVFYRPGFGGVLKPVASNIDWVLIVLAPLPRPHMNLVDRYLVAVETLGLRPLIVLNKADLLTEDDVELDSMLSLYRAIGYPVSQVSSQTGTGIPTLRADLKGSTAVIVGQSGVGKSSLINALSPDLAAQVGQLSQASDKGTHTTTSARLFHADGYDLIDSPGIREFNLWHISLPQLLAGFVEFNPHLGHCKFRDCAHTGEPGCALLKAVESGQIDSRRMASFQQIRQSLGSDSGQ